MFASTSCQRRLSYNWSVNRKTIVRKFRLIGKMSQSQLMITQAGFTPAVAIQFDDMESFEHTRCKPIAIPVVVESKTRRILGISTASMPAKGLLAPIAHKKYGPRLDERKQVREKLFEEIRHLVSPYALIESDMHTQYPASVRKFFPKACHKVYKGRKPAANGQGELKRGGHDPLFWLNHTCAQIRADVSRLIRKTWNTTKRMDQLKLHLAIAALHHNERVLKLDVWPAPDG